MAIKKFKAAGTGGKYLRTPGEYKVTVSDVKFSKSSKGKPMVTVVFENDEEQKISAYFVKELDFHMANLNHLKTCCGLKETSTADELVGHRCGISVDLQPPMPDGKVFSHVTGYGKESEVDEVPTIGGKNERGSDLPLSIKFTEKDPFGEPPPMTDDDLRF